MILPSSQCDHTLALSSLSVLHLCRGRYAGTEFPQDAVQALDVALKHGTALNPECHAVARAFFFRGSQTKSISNGAEVSMPLLAIITTTACPHAQAHSQACQHT